GAIRLSERRGELRHGRLGPQHEIADDAGDPSRVLVEPGVGGGVLGSDASDTCDGANSVRIEEDMLAVRKRHEDLRITETETQSVPLEFEVVDDALPQHAEELSGHRHLEARDDLARDARAADAVAALYDKGREAVPREIAGRDEAVMTGADYDGVVCLHDHVLPKVSKCDAVRAAVPAA